uniref:PHD-type domain-containing protein n=1 Tax=Parascaris univalens TaxID=6257 RepID=A0A915CCV9_PARUN
MDTLLDLDVAYRMCMEQLIASERMLRRKNLSIDEMNKLLDRAERELVLAQEIAYWKRNALLSTDKHLCTITGRKNKPKPEKRKLLIRRLEKKTFLVSRSSFLKARRNFTCKLVDVDNP